MNLQMTRRQEQAYDRTVKQIRERIGSYHQIALKILFNCDKEITGQTVSEWFRDRRVPTHIAFSLYEIMEGDIDPLTLCPWLAEHVTLKETPTCKA